MEVRVCPVALLGTVTTACRINRYSAYATRDTAAAAGEMGAAGLGGWYGRSNERFSSMGEGRESVDHWRWLECASTGMGTPRRDVGGGSTDAHRGCIHGCR